MTIQKLWLTAILLGGLLGGTLSAQPLSNQVLQLLTRINTWTAKNTFLDLRLNPGVPSDTTNRFYADNAGNVYYGGIILGGASGATTPHNILSVTHADTLAGSVVRGDVIIGNATPKWSRLAHGTAGQVLGTDGTDVVYLTSGAALTNLTAGNLTGTLPAISGVNLTNLNASNLASGTVPLARLSGITTTEISGSAAIPYSKLTLTGGIVNADVGAAAAIAYTKLNLTGLIQNADIASGAIQFTKWASNACTNGQVPQFNGSVWGCATLGAGSGTVTSVALTAPAIFAVAGSPVTTTGTLAVTLATETANTIWAGPTTGAAATPTFRALVNADLPLTGVSAGTYKGGVTVNTAGVVTAGVTSLNLTTDVAATILPMANGGTGVAVSADDSVLVGTGAAWAAQTLPNCPTGALGYTTASNTFSCTSSGGPTHNLLSATHPDTVAASPVRGDLIIGNSTPAWTKLAIGTIGQLTTTNGVDPSWSNTVARGTITTSQPWSFTQTWNAGAVTFTGILESITNTASAAASLLHDWQVGGSSKFAIRVDGSLLQGGVQVIGRGTPTITAGFGTSPSIAGVDSAFRVTQGTPVGATGTVTFGTAFTTAPSCVGLDETTTAGNPLKLTATTTTVAFASGGTMVAADKLVVICVGF